jgi:hypothetical protein
LTLRLTNFKTSNGPDVHVMLIAANDAQDNDNWVDLTLGRCNDAVIADQSLRSLQGLAGSRAVFRRLRTCEAVSAIELSHRVWQRQLVVEQ